MKRIVCILLVTLGAVMFAACVKKPSPVGLWRCELYGPETVLELTADGDFIDHTDGSVNKYRIRGNSIVTFVEDVPDSEVALPYDIRDGKLYLGSVAYERVEEAQPNE